MNQAESIHGGWAKKDPPSMTLLKVAEADVRESKLLDVEYEGIKAGTAKGSKGPTAAERQRISHYREIEAAMSRHRRWSHRWRDHRRRIFTQATFSVKKFN